MAATRYRRQLRIAGKRLLRGLRPGRFGRDKRGAAAVEFALTAFPFFAMLFACLETGLVFFAEQSMESGVARAARLIRTGQAQTGGFDEAKFKDAVCHYMIAVSDCQSNLYVDVRTYASFKNADFSSPTEDGKLKTDFQYDPGVGGDIVVVRAFYEWQTYFNFFGYNMSNLSDGKRLLGAATAFRNEPF
ncbi:MAG TPA: pilus assembly protein [Kaistiaceae bacterium]|nr:pilus assembly protein [Kaistiaceae bacterium]